MLREARLRSSGSAHPLCSAADAHVLARFREMALRLRLACPPGTQGSAEAPNPLRAFFDAHKEGPGSGSGSTTLIFKTGISGRFRNREVNVLEVGIYRAAAWKCERLFRPRCRIYGVDIEPTCRAYESDSVRVFIGDQGDRNFWRRFNQGFHHWIS